MEQKFEEAAKQGFDAVGGGANPAVVALCKRFGLEYICYTDANAFTWSERLEQAVKVSPARVNVQMCDHDTPPNEAVEVWLKMVERADQLGLNIDLEIHRDTCTETPEKTYAIADLFQKATGKPIRFCYDFSHLSVIKHLGAPYAPRLLVRPELIQLARQMHFRPFNGHHCQVPATNGRGELTPEFNDYLVFVDELLKLWFAGNPVGETLYATPENGPVASGYGLSVFPNVWEDAVVVRNEIDKLWTSHVSH